MAEAAATATISYDPNCRPLLMGEPADVLAGVHEVLAFADVVKVSAEDLEWLMPRPHPEDVLDDWLGRGPAIVAVTLGGDGVVAGTPDGLRTRRPGVPVKVVDTVGAGDTFSAALLAGLHDRGLLGAAARPALRAVDEPTLRRAARRGRRSPPRSPAPAAGPTRPPAPTSARCRVDGGYHSVRRAADDGPRPFATRRPRTSQRATSFALLRDRSTRPGGGRSSFSSGQRVEHPVGGHLALDGPLAAVAQPVELAGGVRVGVDRERRSRPRPPGAAAVSAGRAAPAGS